MNKLLLLLFISMICIPVYAVYTYTWAPNHPLAEKQQYVRILADSITYKDYNEKNESVSGGYEVIKRSADGLTETTYLGYGLSSDHIYVYSEDGQLLSWKQLHYYENNQFYQDEALYKYDTKGRLIATYSIYHITESDTLENERYIYLDDLTQYTDSGYIHTTVSIKTIRNNNKPEEKRDTIVTEYVFDNQKRLIRAGKNTYTYFDDGSVMMAVYSISDLQPFNQKTVYINDENGYCQGFKRYILKNNIWHLNESHEITYYYKNDPQSNASIAKNSQNVYGVEGGIVATTEMDIPVRIYTLNGQLIKRTIANPNQLIPVLKGVYIVIIDKQAYKVVVK